MSENPDVKPTIVLVHGAYADASSWNGVIERLQQQGYTVIAAANPLRGVTSDSAYIASLLGQIDGPVLLAGHSYGGAVITNAASSAPNVAGLVFVAAFAPDEGETLGEVENGSKDSVLGTCCCCTGGLTTFTALPRPPRCWPRRATGLSSRSPVATERPASYPATRYATASRRSWLSMSSR